MLRRVFAILPSLGWTEMTLLLVIGLLLYGRNLPQAGRSMGRFVAQLKRGFQDFKDQMDRDESLREVRRTFEDTTREVRNLTTLPRAIADPAASLRSIAHDAMHAPPPAEGAGDEEGERADEPPPPAPAGSTVPETTPPPGLAASAPAPRPAPAPAPGPAPVVSPPPARPAAPDSD
jgi:Sec-independent protein translocase protein TatA